MSGATQIFMKVDGINGDAEPEVVKKYIRIYSFQWRSSQTVRSSVGSGSDRQGSGPTLSPFTITKELDVSTPYICQQALTNMKKGLKCKIKYLRSETEPEDYVTLEFKNCIFIDYQVISGPDRPREQLTVDYTELTFEMKQMKDTGGTGDSPKVTWQNPTQKAS